MYCVVVCSAFNHWQSIEARRIETTGASLVKDVVDEELFPNYVLSVHSSRAVLLDQIAMPEFCLADVFLLLAMTNGKRHEVTRNSD